MGVGLDGGRLCAKTSIALLAWIKLRKVGNAGIFVSDPRHLVGKSGCADVRPYLSLSLDVKRWMGQGQSQLVTCSGVFKDGSLRCIRNGIGISMTVSASPARPLPPTPLSSPF